MKRQAFTTTLIFFWSLCFTHLVRSATLAEFMGTYDPGLVLWAAGLSIVGGWLRTIATLQGDDRVIVEKVKEWMWNMFNGLLAGMAAFFAVQAIRSLGYSVPIEVRFGGIVAAGWGGIAFINWMRDSFKNWLGARIPSIYAQDPKDKP